MKRLWTTERYRIRQEIRFRKAERRRLAPQTRGPVRLGGGQGIELVAPAVLSVFDEPEETLRFCADLRNSLNRYRRRVFVDLSGVTRFSSDALLLMRAIIETRTGWRSSVHGNMPSDPDVASKFKLTGFFVGFAKPPGKLPQPRGLMMKKSSRLVYSDVAAELVRFGLTHTKMARAVANACSQTLVEAMTNTHKHAPGDPRSRKSPRGRGALRPWFAGVYCENGVAHFTFVDLGVGILRSAPARAFLRIAGLEIGTYGETRLLRDVFLGVIGSSTGLPGRGQGLPRMKRDCDRGVLPNFQVLTSTVIGRVDDLSFRSLEVGLQGTVFRWRAGEEQVES